MLEVIKQIFINIQTFFLTLSLTIIAIPVVIVLGVMTAISCLFQTRRYSMAEIQDSWQRIKYARVPQ